MRTNGDEYLTTGEAAKRLKITESGVRWLLSRGKLQGHKPGQQWFILASEVERYDKDRKS